MTHLIEPRVTAVLSSDQAERALRGAKARALEIGTPVSIALQDAAGHLVAFLRMDDAFLGSIDLAERKATTSILFRKESQEIWDLGKSDGPAPRLELSNGTLVAFGGGIPLFDLAGEMLGAIGVSGGTVDQDYAIAQAGRDALANA